MDWDFLGFLVRFSFMFMIFYFPIRRKKYFRILKKNLMVQKYIGGKIFYEKNMYYVRKFK